MASHDFKGLVIDPEYLPSVIKQALEGNHPNPLEAKAYFDELKEIKEDIERGFIPSDRMNISSQEYEDLKVRVSSSFVHFLFQEAQTEFKTLARSASPPSHFRFVWMKIDSIQEMIERDLQHAPKIDIERQLRTLKSKLSALAPLDQAFGLPGQLRLTA